MIGFYNVRSNSRLKLTPTEKKDSRGKNVEDRIYTALRFTIYLVCIALFVLNSYAIFIVFINNPTIISTRVSKFPNRMLEFPSILICNDSAFKEPAMHTDYYGYKNNTLSLDDFLVDIVFAKDIGKAILDATTRSIKGSMQEILTAFHGTCFLNSEKLQVSFGHI